jgi:hypothetical protein
MGVVHGLAGNGSRGLREQRERAAGSKSDGGRKAKSG